MTEVYFTLSCLCHLYVVSTLKWAAARSVGGIHAGREFPETHLVHSKSPGSTRTFSLPSCCRPGNTNTSRQSSATKKQKQKKRTQLSFQLNSFVSIQRDGISPELCSRTLLLPLRMFCAVWTHLREGEQYTKSSTVLLSNRASPGRAHTHTYIDIYTCTKCNNNTYAGSTSFRSTLVTHPLVEPAWIPPQW